MKTIFKIFVVTAPLFGGLVAILWFDKRPIVFESKESKTTEDGPIFNEVRYVPDKEQDIWMMRQSHEGLQMKKEDWDRLAIVVSKSAGAKRARFYQLKPGRLEWTAFPEEKNFKVSCFFCHTNGPRAIRPNSHSKNVKVSLWDRGRIFLWNMRIKTYLRVEEDPVHRTNVSQVPFRRSGAFENEKLNVPTCLKCHNASSWGRGYLTRQNFTTVQFMTKQRYMPPFGFGLNKDEKRELEHFLVGF